MANIITPTITAFLNMDARFITKVTELSVFGNVGLPISNGSRYFLRSSLDSWSILGTRYLWKYILVSFFKFTDRIETCKFNTNFVCNYSDIHVAKLRDYFKKILLLHKGFLSNMFFVSILISRTAFFDIRMRFAE